MMKKVTLLTLGALLVCAPLTLCNLCAQDNGAGKVKERAKLLKKNLEGQQAGNQTRYPTNKPVARTNAPLSKIKAPPAK